MPGAGSATPRAAVVAGTVRVRGGLGSRAVICAVTSTMLLKGRGGEVWW